MPVFHSDPWGVCVKYITSTPCTAILSAVTASLFYLYGSSKAQVSETMSSYYWCYISKKCHDVIGKNV